MSQEWLTHPKQHHIEHHTSEVPLQSIIPIVMNRRDVRHILIYMFPIFGVGPYLPAEFCQLIFRFTLCRECCY